MITSASNDKIKEIKKLIKSASRRKETGLYIVEGIRMVREIPADAVKTLYVAESMTDKFADICNQIPAEVEIVRDSVFQSMSDTNTPQGILAEVYQTATTEDDLFAGDAAPFLLIIERLQDPTFIPDGSNTVYCIFMIIGIVGYFCVPTVASWIIQAGGAGSYGDKVAGAGRAVAMGAAGVAGAAVGNVGGRIKGALKKR